MIKETTFGKGQVIRTIEDFFKRRITYFDCTVVRYWNDDLTDLIAQAVVRKNFIYYVVVNPNYRKQGFGSKLIKDAIVMIPGDVYLSPQDNDENLINFYKKLGFEIHSKNKLGEIIMLRKR